MDDLQPTPNAAVEGTQTQDVATTANSTARDSVLDAAPSAPTEAGFELPDAYKDKPWAQDIKSTEDLYTRIDELNDPIKAFDRFKPTTSDDYTVPEVFGAEADEIKALMLEMGLPPQIANERVLTKYAEYQQRKHAELVSEEGFDSEMNRIFGKDYTDKATQVTALIKSVVTPEQFDIIKALPNQYVGLVYEMMNNMRSAYAVKEIGGQPATPDKAVAATNTQEIRMALHKELEELSRRPHTAAQRNAILDKLNNM